MSLRYRYFSSLILVVTLLLAPSAFSETPVSKFPDDWFQSFDQSKVSQVEGELTEVSVLPEAATCDYPDCLFTARITMKQTLKGPALANEVILVFPGFKDRTPCTESALKKGDRVRIQAVPFESLPEAMRQIQQADDINSLELEYYFAAKTEKIAGWSAKDSASATTATAAAEAKPKEDVIVLPIDKKAQAARAKAIKKDLDRINSLLAKHGGSFDQWYNDLADMRTSYTAQRAANATKWVGNSYFAAQIADITKPKIHNFIDIMIRLDQYLKKRNIDLIILRVPRKSEICLDLFAMVPEDGVFNPYLLQINKTLLEAGVEIVDVQSVARKTRFDYPLMYYYQKPKELHPAEGMAWVIAEEISKRLERYPEFRKAKKQFALQCKTPEPGVDNTFYWPEGNSRFDSRKLVEFRSVAQNDGSTLSLKENVSSPILVIGNSFITYPDMRKGASIPHYLAYQTGIAPNVLVRNGTSDIPRYLLRKQPGFLSGRRVCIYPFRPDDLIVEQGDFPAELDEKKMERIIAYEGDDLAIPQYIPDLGSHAFKISAQSEIEIRPLPNEKSAGGKIKIPFPKVAPHDKRLVVELVFSKSDHVAISVSHGDETKIARRSPFDPENNERFIFTPSSGNGESDINIEFFDGLLETKPTLLRQVNLYSVQ